MSVELSRTRGESLRLRAAGAAWLAFLLVLVLLSVATYDKAFDGHVTAEVHAPRTGLQLNVGGDVRMNGAIVGRVSGVSPAPDGAVVEIQVDGDAARRIPATATARILPTTLFGQKYVELTSRAAAGPAHLVDGTVLRAAPDATDVELTDVLDDLDVVLRSVSPQRLSSLLHEVAAGLDGQGRPVAALLRGGGAYLAELNDASPALVRDLALLDEVTGAYSRDVPDLLALLDHTTTTTSTVTAGSRWPELLDGVTRTSDAGRRLLEASRRSLREATSLSRPTLELLAEYSPELSCVITGFLGVRDSSAAQVKNGSVEGYFTVGEQVDGYSPDERLVLGDLGTGPSCRGLPDAPVPYPAVDLHDGAKDR